MLDFLYAIFSEAKVLGITWEEEDTIVITVQSNEQAKDVKDKHVWLRTHLIVNSPFLNMYGAWHFWKSK